MRKPFFPPVQTDEPPAKLLKAWADVEVALGEPLSRGEMATIATMFLTAYYAKAVTCETPADVFDRVVTTRSLLKGVYESGHADYIKEYIQ